MAGEENGGESPGFPREVHRQAGHSFQAAQGERLASYVDCGWCRPACGGSDKSREEVPDQGNHNCEIGECCLCFRQ